MVDDYRSHFVCPLQDYNYNREVIMSLCLLRMNCLFMRRGYIYLLFFIAPGCRSSVDTVNRQMRTKYFMPHFLLRKILYGWLIIILRTLPEIEK